MKYIKITIITLIILIIIVITSIIVLLKIPKEQKDYEAAMYGDVEEVTNETTYYTINNSIIKYFNYISKGDSNAVKAIENSNLQDITNLYNKPIKFDAKTMYSIDKVYQITAFVYGTIEENEYYLIVNLDYDNKTFSVSHINKQVYDNAKNNIVDEIYRQNIEIQKNEYNEISKIEITDFNILKNYFEDYKYKALNNIELAFDLLDTEYKKEKFGNSISVFKEYIENNKDKLVDANIVKHGVSRDEGYRQYVAIDNYNNYYKFIEIGINKYMVILDNYTLETDELKAEYNKLSTNEKIVSNIDKIFKLINTKQYVTLYSYVNEDFKNNYFKTQESFKKYIEDNFFDNNIVGAVSISNQGDIYITRVPYKESLSNAAEKKETTFIIKLKQGTDFELSFNVE